MTETLLNQGGDDPLQDVKALVANWMKCLSDMQQALEENEQLRQRVAALESENAQKDEEIKNLSTELQEKERKLTELEEIKAWVMRDIPEEELRMKVMSACEEWFVNIMFYSEAKSILFDIVRENQLIKVTFADDGTPFDPTSYMEEKAFEELDTGGMGIEMIRNMTRTDISCSPWV